MLDSVRIAAPNQQIAEVLVPQHTPERSESLSENFLAVGDKQQWRLGASLTADCA